MQTNILIDILSILDVKYTKGYATEYFNLHPNKNTLYGLSQMLHAYKIENKAIEIITHESYINCLPLPFIACLQNEFVLV